MPERITIVVVVEDRERAVAIVDALQASGPYDVHVIGNMSSLARRIAALAPDVVLIDNPTRDVLEELTLASGPMERPVAMFVSGAVGRRNGSHGLAVCKGLDDGAARGRRPSVAGRDLPRMRRIPAVAGRGTR